MGPALNSGFLNMKRLGVLLLPEHDLQSGNAWAKSLGKRLLTLTTIKNT